MSLPPELRDGAVHVWHTKLDFLPEHVAALVSDDERARGARIAGEQRRALWLRGRGLLRLLIGGYVRADPQTLRFSSGHGGKPRLVPASALSTVLPCFNVAHSRGIAVYAFSHAGEVGVDVEAEPRSRNCIALAQRFFGSEHARRLALLDPPHREHEFHRLWVQFEAAAKLSGEGIGRVRATRSLKDARERMEDCRHGAAHVRAGTDVPVHGDVRAGMLRARPCARAGGRLDGAGSCVDELCLDYPWIEELQIGAHVAAAIALDREPSELVCRRVQLSGDASTAPRLS